MKSQKTNHNYALQHRTSSWNGAVLSAKLASHSSPEASWKAAMNLSLSPFPESRLR